MLPRGLIALVIALALIFGANTHALAADPANGTVADMFKNQNSGHKSQTDQSHSAQTNSNNASPSVLGGSNLFIDFVKIVFALLLVLALIYLLYRFAAKRTGKFRTRNALKNLGGVSVGTNRSVQLIRVGNEVMVIGVGDTVQLLKEISDPAEIEVLSEQEEAANHMEKSVIKALQWTGKTLRKKDNEKNDDWETMKLKFRERLSLLNSGREEKMQEVIREVKQDE